MPFIVLFLMALIVGVLTTALDREKHYNLKIEKLECVLKEDVWYKTSGDDFVCITKETIEALGAQSN